MNNKAVVKWSSPVVDYKAIIGDGGAMGGKR